MEAPEVVKAAFAMPLTSPSFARGPYRYTNREYLVITYCTDRAALEEAVPEPLTFDEPLVRCEFMRMESSTGFGRYSGAAQHIPVKLNGKPGAYTHNMYLDVYAPISGGRELWGFPQKLAKPRLAVEHDTLVGTLEYGPVQVAKGTMGYKHRALAQDAAVRMFSEPNFLLKIIPHVDGSRAFVSWCNTFAATSCCMAPGPAPARLICIRTRSRRSPICRCWRSSTAFI